MIRKPLIAALAAAVGIAALVHVELERRTVYSFGVEDFLKRDVRDRRVRVAGTLVKGTLCRIEPDCGYRFRMTDPYTSSAGAAPAQARHSTLPISFEGCVVPDSFYEQPGLDLDVVVEGQRCQKCHDFEATTILTRTYREYEQPSYPSDAAPPARPLPPTCDAVRPSM